jgi:hypothetical protein
MGSSDVSPHHQVATTSLVQELKRRSTGLTGVSTVSSCASDGATSRPPPFTVSHHHAAGPSLSRRSTVTTSSVHHKANHFIAPHKLDDDDDDGNNNDADDDNDVNYDDISALPPAYKTTSLPLVDRLAARDRAYSLLVGVTRRGTAWNLPEAWFALASAYEESGQIDRAKEALWWCVELEEGRAVRDWRDVARARYVL